MMIKQIRLTIISFLSFLLLLPAVEVLAQDGNRFEVSKQLDIYNALIKELEMFYVDSIDMEKTVRTGINSMLRTLDPYTEYYPEQEIENLNFLSTGQYAGIGAVITQREEGVVINEPYEGMPAQTAGLKAGDLILEIDGVDMRKETSSKVSDLLRGVPNTTLKVKVQRPGEAKPREFELVRKQIKPDQVTHYEVRGDGVGYIYLNGFTDNSYHEVKTAFNDLKNNHHIKSLVLDLRNNGGGILKGAVQIVNMFVPKGKTVVTTKSKLSQWDRAYRTSVEPLDTVMPMAVLINGESASAAEIVAGALQDLDRAVLIGQRSFGKGLVQAPRDLPYNSSLKVTVSKYYIPSGRCIQHIDYSNRDANGRPVVVPDSLTSVFYTANGRPVRDGGGVKPEFEIEEKELPTMMYYLLVDNTLFDFVTDWTQKHPTIASPTEFSLSDDDFEAFKAYAKERNFTYDRQSEKMLKSLEEMARFEGFLEADSTLFKELEQKLTPDLDRDFDRFKSDIINILEAAIIKRYYFQRGELIYTLRDDPVLDKAIEVLNNPGLVQQTLAKPEDPEEKMMSEVTNALKPTRSTRSGYAG